MAEMAQELAQALAHEGLAVLRGGPRAGALIGLQLALDYSEAVTALVCVNGWLSLNAHTVAAFRSANVCSTPGRAGVGGAQPLFLYPADWMAARAPRMEAEESLALAHFQGKHNLLRRLTALKQANFSRHAARIRCPVHIICSADDLLVPSVCSSELQAAMPGSQKVVMRQGGHACNDRTRYL
jgi:aminoacrylate hydrolase